MGFWDIVNAAGEKVQEKQARIMRYKDRFESLDDETLKRKARNSSGDAQLAALLILKERGYGKSDL